MKVRMISVLCGCLFIAGLASAQELESFTLSRFLLAQQPQEKLDEVARELLFDPVVLVEIGVTPEQLRTVDFSRSIEFMMLLLAMSRAEGDWEMFAASLRGSESNHGTLSILSEPQKRRPKQIALRRSPLESLLTSEMSFALGITEDQQRQLRELFTNRASFAVEVADKLPESRQFAELLYELQLREDDDPLRTMVMMFNRINDLMVSFLTQMNAQTTEPGLDWDKKALDLLTEAQQAHYSQMAGGSGDKLP